MVRSVLSVVIGVIAASALVLIVELVGHSMFPPPTDLDPGDPASIAKVPFSAKFAVVIAWFVGAFGGGAVASLIAKRWAPAAWVVAGTILLLAGVTMLQFPHPYWMMIGAVVATGLGGFLSTKLTKAYYGRPFAGGPKPGL
ncbi:MAG TPA: hypothetical protein PKH09_05835 [Parvularculaceae bacterium]|nr:hypothetical protein [Parvularculaceae bacterium]